MTTRAPAAASSTAACAARPCAGRAHVVAAVPARRVGVRERSRTRARGEVPLLDRVLRIVGAAARRRPATRRSTPASSRTPKSVRAVGSTRRRAARRARRRAVHARARPRRAAAIAASSPSGDGARATTRSGAPPQSACSRASAAERSPLSSSSAAAAPPPPPPSATVAHANRCALACEEARAHRSGGALRGRRDPDEAAPRAAALAREPEVSARHRGVASCRGPTGAPGARRARPRGRAAAAVVAPRIAARHGEHTPSGKRGGRSARRAGLHVGDLRHVVERVLRAPRRTRPCSDDAGGARRRARSAVHSAITLAASAAPHVLPSASRCSARSKSRRLSAASTRRRRGSRRG